MLALTDGSIAKHSFLFSCKLAVRRADIVACLCFPPPFVCSFVANNANMSLSIRLLLVTFLFAFAAQVFAQTSSAASIDTPPITGTASASATGSAASEPAGSATASSNTRTSPTTSAPSVSKTSTVPDVLLQVPELHVGRIELIVEKLQADLNLNAKVAGLVQVNAGVMVAVEKVNITIADVDVNLELVVRLGNLVEIVERVFDSLDLNPLLLSLIGNVTNLVGEVIGAVDGLVSSDTVSRYPGRLADIRSLAPSPRTARR